MPIPSCRICGNSYQFPDCELENIMYPRAGQPGPWGALRGTDDKVKFETWTRAQIEAAQAQGRPPGELGLNLILLGKKEGLHALVPMLSGSTQQRWDFILKRLVPFSFSLTHARPGGYETDRIQKWVAANFDRLRWDETKKAFVLG